MEISKILRGIVTALVVTLVVIILASAAAYFIQPDEGIINCVLFVGGALGVFLGAYPVARSVSGKILVHCIFVGIGYLAVITCLSLGVNKIITFNVHFWTIIASTVFAALLGGVLGVRGRT